MMKLTALITALLLLLAAGGCEGPPEYRVAQIDLEELIETAEPAEELQRQLEKRSGEYEEYYQQLDRGEPETEEQRIAYIRYQKEYEEIQNQLDSRIEAAIEELEKSGEFDAVVTAEAAHRVNDDITAEVAEKMEKLAEEGEYEE